MDDSKISPGHTGSTRKIHCNGSLHTIGQTVYTSWLPQLLSFHTGISPLRPLSDAYAPPTKRLRSARHLQFTQFFQSNTFYSVDYFFPLHVSVVKCQSSYGSLRKQFQAEVTETNASPPPASSSTPKHLRDTPSASAGLRDAVLPLDAGSHPEMAHLTTQILEKRQQLRVRYV